MQNEGSKPVWREREQKISALEADHGPEVVSGGGGSHYLPSHPLSPSPASAYHAHQPPFPQSEVTEKKESSKICGLRRPTSYLALVLAFVVIAASVGGGVGGSYAVYQTRNKSQADAQATEAVTVTVINADATPTQATGTATGTATGLDTRIPTPTLGLLPLDCPNLTGKTMTVNVGGKTWGYDLECGGDNTGSGIDITAVVSYSLRDYLLACSSYSSREGATSGIDPCAGVQFNADMLDLLGSFSGNCFLKRREGVVMIDTNMTNFNIHVSAYLRT
ncbi:hypothetical protein CMUS01_07189 [Colletotrichum musicola]|uniref:Uncharacterized protein n=1 Tax=Colletotrichum musicola TaxID=2175873 RepID=A0A8H6KHX6_9PEZI|nr:hypothetical protein CMUS01_07189 [Colletotrichum musicola]